MNQNLYFYFHAGSKNHGCEAIVRATQKLLGGCPTLISACPKDDNYYGINQIASVQGKPTIQYSFLEKVFCKLLKNEEHDYHLVAKHESVQYQPPGVALSVGGDNYCYGDAYNYYLDGMNQYLHRRGLKTVLWGCSVEPKTVTPVMEKDFARYDLIAARETISYECLKKFNPQTVLICDPAFHLEKDDMPLPDGFIPGRTVGINLSPMIQKNETVPGITMDNYKAMVEYILGQTDYSIALIPHVVLDSNDDRIPLQQLYNTYAHTGRILLIKDCNCMQLKGYISRCVMFIGARTHATIAAYSTGVPTLVVGYSTKATGIARDLFGTEENYVLPVQNLEHKTDMTKAFCWLDDNKEQIHTHLIQILPEYLRRINNGLDAMEKL